MFWKTLVEFLKMGMFTIVWAATALLGAATGALASDKEPALCALLGLVLGMFIVPFATILYWEFKESWDYAAERVRRRAQAKTTQEQK